MYHISPADALVSADIPPDDPIYDRIERVSDLGLAPTDVHAFRPLTEDQLYRVFRRATSTENLPKEAEADLQTIGRYLETQGFPAAQPDRSHANARIRGGLWGTNSESEAIPEVSARVNPLLEEQGGRWREGGVAGWTEPSLTARWLGWGTFEARPRFHLHWSPEGNGSFTEAELYSAYLKLGWGGFEAQGGRFAVRWGHALSGSLLLGGTQSPLTGGQIRNAVPAVFPGIFRLLGPTQFSLIIARLDGDQFFPNSFLVAERLGLRPSEWLELGFAQSIILGGKGSPDLSTWDAILEVLGKRKGNIYGGNFSNRNFLFDFRLQIPPWNDFALYSETFFEDCCGGKWARDISNLAGVSIPLRIRGRSASLHAEWVRTTEITYRNSPFRSGFEDRGHLLGHPIGPDAMGFYLFARYQLRDPLWIQGRLAFERRGRNEKNQGGGDIRTVVPTFQSPESRIQFSLRPTWQYTPTLWFRGELGYEWVKNFAFLDNNTRHHVLGAMEAGLTF